VLVFGCLACVIPLRLELGWFTFAYLVSAWTARIWGTNLRDVEVEKASRRLAHCNKKVLVWMMETSGSPKAVHSWQYIAPIAFSCNTVSS